MNPTSRFRPTPFQKPLLEHFALLYAGLPAVLFLFFWFAPPFNLLFLALAFLAFYAAFVSGNPLGRGPFLVATPRERWLLVAGVLAVCFLYGVGGYVPQSDDYTKHNFIFRELRHSAWPIGYRYEDGQVIQLVYYFGYYLLPALVGKLLGSEVLYAASLLNAAVGITLGLFLWRKHFGLKALPAFALLLMSGLDFAGNLVTHEKALVLGQHYEWWAKCFQYPATASMLRWVPQHAVAGILFTPLVLGALKRHRLEQAVCSFALSFFWSPFVTLGLVPFFLWALWRKPVRGYFSPASFAAIFGLLLPFALYYSTKIFPERFLPIWLSIPGVLPPEIFRCYGLLLVFEVLPWALLVAPGRLRRPLFPLTLAILVLLPLGHLGLYNDWAMRISIPALLVLWALALRECQGRALWRRLLFAGFFALGLLTPLNEAAPSFTRRWFSSGNRPIDKRFVEKLDLVTRQYLGSSQEHPAFSFVLTQPRSRPIASEWHLMKIPQLWEGTRYGNFESNDAHLWHWCQPKVAVTLDPSSDRPMPVQISFRIESFDKIPFAVCLKTPDKTQTLSVGAEGLEVKIPAVLFRQPYRLELETSASHGFREGGHAYPFTLVDFKLSDQPSLP